MRPSSILRLTLVGLLFLAGPALAQTYKWVDKNGTVHFTDNPYELPEPQRSEVLRKLEQERKSQKQSPADAEQPEDDRPVRHESYRPEKNDAVERSRKSGERLPDGPAVAPLNANTKKHWQAKAQAAKKKVVEIRAKCRQLENTRDQGRRKHLLFGQPGALESSGQAAEKLEACQKELAKAIRFLEEELPEKARRAGVPKRWVE